MGRPRREGPVGPCLRLYCVTVVIVTHTVNFPRVPYSLQSCKRGCKGPGVSNGPPSRLQRTPTPPHLPRHPYLGAGHESGGVARGARADPSPQGGPAAPPDLRPSPVSCVGGGGVLRLATWTAGQESRAGTLPRSAITGRRR